jgi:cytosine/adenosine deaminase-related metal-dependent hydrolase
MGEFAGHISGEQAMEELMEELKVGRLVAEPGKAGPLYGATVRWRDGKIVEVQVSGHADDAGADRGLLAMPALADAHDHARGLHHLAFGAKDQSFELWRVALYAHPPIDPYLNAALAFGRLARAGVSAVMHVYSSIFVERMVQDAEAIARAARDVGIRLAFVVPLRDKMTIGYGDDDDLLARHDPRDHEILRSTWLHNFLSPKEYKALVREIASRIEGATVRVQLGPNSPQCCTDALLEAIAEESAATNRRITTHLLETSTQREWADAAYPGHCFIRHLDRLGILSDRFIGAHGVWLRPEDIALMAERRAAIAVNTSSNLRLRSGIAPVAEYIKAGMRFAIGIDSFSIDDDDDALRELRVTHWLHSPHHNSGPLTADRLFTAGMQNGFHAVTNSRQYGAVTPGMPADLIVLDYDAMAYDVIDGMADEQDVLLTRANNRHIRHVFVAGRQVVRDGRVLGVDMEAVEKEVLAQARAASARMRELKPVMDRSMATLEKFYRAGDHARSK